MGRKRKNSLTKKVGLPPGTLVYTGEPNAYPPKIWAMIYSASNCTVQEVNTVEDAFKLQKEGVNLWINIDGIQDVALIKKVGDHFKLHSLTLEDVLNPNQRPKKEDFDNFVYIVARALSLKDLEVEAEQVSIVLGQYFLLSFQERPGDAFESVRQRLLNDSSRLRKMGVDYLCYALLDTIVDNYFVILEHLGESIEALEAEVVDNPTPATLTTIHRIKRQGLLMRRSVWPLREVLSSLEREHHPLITKETSLFLRDVYDHLVQVIDTKETYREMLSGMLDIYLSSVSNKMNAVMKVLTIITTIFMPLTFIAGIYGMNFEHMPELKWRYGYFLVLGVMVLLAFAMIRFFRRKRWL